MNWNNNERFITMFISWKHRGKFCSVLFCFLAVVDPRVGHTMVVLSPFISVLCHSDWLFHGESCPRLDVVHPGPAWPSSPSCTWHCSLHYLFLKATFSGVRWKSGLMNPHKITPGYDTLLIDSVHVVVKVKSYMARLWSSAPLSYTHAYINEYTYYVGKIPSFWQAIVWEKGDKSNVIIFVMYLNNSA